MTVHHTPRVEFIALVALLTAMVGMSIDTMLPGIGIMAQELNAAHSNDRQYIVLGFFAGLTFGMLIFGPISDSIGRKPTIFIGLAMFIAGAALCFFATSFPMLIIGRVLQGFGASGPRSVSMAMVRDNASGNAMARIMSFVMSIFMLVPIFAPTIGQFVLDHGSWRDIFGGFIVAAVVAAIWLYFRQEETLHPEYRRPFSAAAFTSAAAEVIRNPVSLGYTLAAGFIFSGLNCYLVTAQQIFAEQYGQGKYFSFWFSGFALALAAAMIFNGRAVMRLGMRNLTKWSLRGFIVVWICMCASCLTFAGHPPLALIAVLFSLSFFCCGLLFGNLNALALEPMGHIAGTAAAVSGMLSSLIALLLGGLTGQQYDGTLYPLSVSYLVFGILAWGASEWAARHRTERPMGAPAFDAGHM